MNNEFKEKKILIFGTGGSGKTVYSKDLWDKFDCPMAYDINNDFEKLKGGISYVPNDIQGELLTFVNFFMKEKKKKIDALFFDDSDMYFNEAVINDPTIRDLIIRQRNKYKVTLVFISKRPQNLPTLITNNAHILITFRMEGFNAINRIKDIDTAMYDLLPKINENPYSYAIKKEGEQAVYKPPVKI